MASKSQTVIAYFGITQNALNNGFASLYSDPVKYLGFILNCS